MKKVGFLLSAVLTVASASAHADVRMKCDTTAKGQGSIFLSMSSDLKTMSYQMADPSGISQLWSGSLTCQGPQEAAYSCSGQIDRGILFMTAQMSIVIGEATIEGGAGQINDNTQQIQYNCSKAPAHVLKGSDATEIAQLLGSNSSSGVFCFAENGTNVCYLDNGKTQINDQGKDSEIWKLLHHAGFLDTPNQGSEGATGQPTISATAMTCAQNICTFAN